MPIDDRTPPRRSPITTSSPRPQETTHQARSPSPHNTIESLRFSTLEPGPSPYFLTRQDGDSLPPKNPYPFRPQADLEAQKKTGKNERKREIGDDERRDKILRRMVIVGGGLLVVVMAVVVVVICVEAVGWVREEGASGKLGRVRRGVLVMGDAVVGA